MANAVDPGAPSGPPDAPDAPAPAPTAVTQPLPAGTNIIGAVQITDGSVRIAAVKAGTTPAVAADQSLVVAHSPNSPTPPGSNAIGSVSVNAALPAGNNNIGDVDIVTMPAITGAVTTDALKLADVVVKAASTPAAAADKSLVVAHSPNSPTPAGSNHIGGVLVDAALPAGTNNIGKVDVNSLPAAPSPVTLAPSAPAQASVGVASALALAANAARKGVVFVNRSAAYISFGLGAAAVMDNGITLAPNGVWQMDKDTFTTGAINAIAGAAASLLAIQEFA